MLGLEYIGNSIYFVALSYPHSAFSCDYQMGHLRALRATTFLFDSIFRCMLPVNIKVPLL